MYGIYDKDTDGVDKLLAKVATKEDAELILSHLNYWCDEVCELMGRSEFEENFGHQEYYVKEIVEE